MYNILEGMPDGFMKNWLAKAGESAVGRAAVARLTRELPESDWWGATGLSVPAWAEGKNSTSRIVDNMVLLLKSGKPMEEIISDLGGKPGKLLKDFFRLASPHSAGNDSIALNQAGRAALEIVTLGVAHEALGGMTSLTAEAREEIWQGLFDHSRRALDSLLRTDHQLATSIRRELDGIGAAIDRSSIAD